MIIITLTGNRLALGPVLFTVDHIKSLIFSSLIPKQFIIIVSGGKYQLLFLGQNCGMAETQRFGYEHRGKNIYINQLCIKLGFLLARAVHAVIQRTYSC